MSLIGVYPIFIDFFPVWHGGWHGSCTSADMKPNTHSTPEEVDLNRKFVRVTDRLSNGMVAFEFSIGWPELVVELMLPAAAFESFCVSNAVIRLDEEGATTTQPTTGDKL
jgi:phenol/toluene 2-monooxygenase (NADH) P0/A0